MALLHELGIRDLFLQGVYNSTYEVITDGGPKCASESTVGFKYASNLLLLPMHLYLLWVGARYVVNHH